MTPHHSHHHATLCAAPPTAAPVTSTPPTAHFVVCGRYPKNGGHSFFVVFHLFSRVLEALCGPVLIPKPKP